MMKSLTIAAAFVVTTAFTPLAAAQPGGAEQRGVQNSPPSGSRDPGSRMYGDDEQSKRGVSRNPHSSRDRDRYDERQASGGGTRVDRGRRARDDDRKAWRDDERRRWIERRD
jgi:hypothetical protein